MNDLIIAELEKNISYIMEEMKLGRARDFTEYQVKVAEIALLTEIIEYIKKLEGDEDFAEN